MKYLIAAAVLLALGGEAQANCVINFGRWQCWDGPVLAPQVSPYQAFINGMMEGREYRLRTERMELENELLRRRLNGQ